MFSFDVFGVTVYTRTLVQIFIIAYLYFPTRLYVVILQTEDSSVYC